MSHHRTWYRSYRIDPGARKLCRFWKQFFSLFLRGGYCVSACGIWTDYRTGKQITGNRICWDWQYYSCASITGTVIEKSGKKTIWHVVESVTNWYIAIDIAMAVSIKRAVIDCTTTILYVSFPAQVNISNQALRDFIWKWFRNQNSKKKNAYGQHSALSYVCDQGVYHQSEWIRWVVSIPQVHVYRVENGF